MLSHGNVYKSCYCTDILISSKHIDIHTLSVLKIHSLRYVYYRFSILAICRLVSLTKRGEVVTYIYMCNMYSWYILIHYNLKWHWTITKSATTTVYTMSKIFYVTYNILQIYYKLIIYYKFLPLTVWLRIAIIFQIAFCLNAHTQHVSKPSGWK